MSAWAANDNVLKVSLDLVRFGDTVVVYRTSQQDVFVDKDGRFELKVDSPCSAKIPLSTPFSTNCSVNNQKIRIK